ncbi:MAG: hypothetical protein LBB41_01225 [Prevotellaceae bacterium]|jgi:tetratricopeptide (TPR) repeat protein|nr:hypothetical protein [Prevotellaceae bacterium]
MKTKIILAISLFSAIYICGQNDTIPDENFLGKSFLRAKEQNLDEATVKACECINAASALRNEKSRARATKKCIEKQVFGFQFISKLANIANLPDSADNADYKLTLSTNKKAIEYQKYYDEIERNLLKQCDSITVVMIKTSEIDFNALSDNAEAMEFYEKAEKLAKSDKWKSAMKNYEKAVSIDENFAVAWEKLGLCYRHTNKGDKAVSAYKRAKEIRQNLIKKAE